MLPDEGAPLNPATQLIRRGSHDFIVRLRTMLAGTMPDEAASLGREAVERIAETACGLLGVEYTPPPDVPRRASDGRPTPWARKGGRGRLK